MSNAAPNDVRVGDLVLCQYGQRPRFLGIVRKVSKGTATIWDGYADRTSINAADVQRVVARQKLPAVKGKVDLMILGDI